MHYKCTLWRKNEWREIVQIDFALFSIHCVSTTSHFAFHMCDCVCLPNLILHNNFSLVCWQRRSAVRFIGSVFVYISYCWIVYVKVRTIFLHSIGHVFILFYDCSFSTQLLPHFEVYDEIEITNIKCIYIVISFINDSKCFVGTKYNITTTTTTKYTVAIISKSTTVLIAFHLHSVIKRIMKQRRRRQRPLSQRKLLLIILVVRISNEFLWKRKSYFEWLQHVRVWPDSNCITRRRSKSFQSAFLFPFRFRFQFQWLQFIFQINIWQSLESKEKSEKHDWKLALCANESIKSNWIKCNSF